MTNIEKIRTFIDLMRSHAIAIGYTRHLNKADAALAELERAAAPAPTQDAIAGAVADILGDAYHCERAWSAWSHGTMTEDDFYSVNESDTPNEIAAKVAELYAAPPAPVAEIREVVVTDEMCERIYMRYLETQDPGCKPTRQIARVWLDAWRAELGPALGLVEIREPTPEECEKIARKYRGTGVGYTEGALRRYGRDLFAAVAAVLWPKEGL